MLVNELLLYGASYTATNNSLKTPVDLTRDDQVKELIWKASRGIIPVGSYRPLKTPYTNHTHSNVDTVSSHQNGSSQSHEERRLIDWEVVEASHVESASVQEIPQDLEWASSDVSPFEEHRALGDQGMQSTRGQGSSDYKANEWVSVEEELIQPHPHRGNEKLVTLLKAIEVFDRSDL